MTGDFKVVTGSFDFEWDIISAIVSGGSAIDLGRLDIATHDQAQAFLAAYGFDPTDEEGQREIAKILPLALRFIEEELMPVGQYREVPSDLPHDPIQLILIASQVDHPLRDWACSLLRVCHVVAHGLYLPGRDHVAEACTQVVARFKEHLKGGDDSLALGPIPLMRCDFKLEKPWNSLLLKLLCKKDSVAEEIYDQVGVRMVTSSKADALQIVRYLREKNVIVYPNIKPSRSHNTLIDLSDFRRHVGEAWADLETGKIDSVQFEDRVNSYSREPSQAADAPKNPYSDQLYRSIQFTARILVSRKVKAGHPIERFFFPFEIQIMDLEAYRHNIVGKSNHRDYRQRQRIDARRRVFPWARLPAPQTHVAEFERAP